MGSLSQTSGRTYLGVLKGATPEESIDRIILAINNILTGALLCVGDVTLTANAATTTLTDQNIGPNSFIYFMPTTANASSEVGAGAFYVSVRTEGSATITHANNANADRTFTYIVVG